MALIFSGVISAAELPLTTNQSGTVSGGLYFNATQPTPFNEQTQNTGVTQEAVYNFAPSGYTNVTFAKFYTLIYTPTPEGRDCYVNVSFDGNNDGIYETILENETLLNINSDNLGNVYWLNDHINRVYSDYFLTYDVTKYITSSTMKAKVQTIPGNPAMDGRIKFMALVVAYNDGDYDRINYWVNDGHQWFNSGSRQTIFDTSSMVSGWNSSELMILSTSSTDATYKFNGIPKSGAGSVSNYFNVNTWNVNSDITPGTSSALVYTKNGDSFKTQIALLSVKYPQPTDLADLIPETLVIPSNLVVNQTYQINSTIANRGLTNTTKFQVNFYDDSNLISSINLNSLNAGDTTNLSFNWKPTKIGFHNLKVVLDALNQVQEANEINNEFARILDVEPPKADLLPLNPVIPTRPVVNQTFQIKTNIGNQGLADAGTFLVVLYDNKQEIGRQLINNLGVGDVVECIFNWTPNSTGPHDLEVLIDILNQVNESTETNNQITGYVVVKDKKISILLISDDPGSIILNKAAYKILEQYSGQVSIQIRTNTQATEMADDKLKAYLTSCDIFIGNWISTDASEKIYNILKANGDIAYNKKVFLVLEPDSTHTDLMNYSVINGTILLKNYNSTQLSNYKLKTERNDNYTNITNYMAIAKFPAIYNTATLYKCLEDENNAINEILWALNIYGFQTSFNYPVFSSDKQISGIYRHRWYTLKEYINTFFKSDRVGCVGLIESTKYVDAQNLEIYYKIIEELEERGLNVLPVTAYGASDEQLEVMVKVFTNATNATKFIADPTKYLVRTDAIIEMPAYGMGGEDFTLATDFFTALNVPILRAIHSDTLTNEKWELSTTGLPTGSGDKWWHVAISESQGVIEPTFVGGKANLIDPVTGAAIGNYVPHVENIELLAGRIKGWVQLKYMTNALKKVALIYYNYPPGKNNIGASYLDPIQSILNLLKVLKNEGYTVENIPVNATDLEKLMLSQGINVANWAPGEVEKLADNPNVVLYSVDEYMNWFSQLDEITQLYVTQGPVAYIGELCKKAVQLGYTSDPDYIQDLNNKIDTWLKQILPLVPDEKLSVAIPVLNNIVDSLKKYVSSRNASDWNDYLNYKSQFLNLDVAGMSGWGEAPGDIMVVKRNGKKYFVLPGIKFGNIFIGPEPQRGWEADADQLYHNCAVPPHHQYLAFFAWLQQQGTDAMVYIGRHATHEWLPGKEVILAPTDFPSIVTGSVPQIYFYIADGLAEGIQAKRRGYAVIIDHLTPPMTYTSLYGGLAQLAQLAEDYDGANSTQKQNIIVQIKKVIIGNGYETGMGVEIDNLSASELIAAVNTYISDIQSTLYPYGLYVIGEKWSDNQTALMVTSMLSVAFQLPSSTETTTLQNEISLILLGKTFESLSVWEKDEMQGACIKIVKALIHSDVATIAAQLTSKPSNKLIITLEKAKNYTNLINESVDNEIESFINALNGGYVAPGPGADPISNPDVLPTGRNFYQDQAAEIPTKEAYEYGKTLALLLLNGINESTKKVAVGIWCVETARDNGALVSMILYLLGMEPQWSDSPSAGVGGQKLKEMPIYIELKNLIRPAGWSKKRIDAVIITSGLFRDLYSRQAGLLDNAFRITLARSYYTILANKTLKAKYGNKIKAALDPIMSGIGYYGVGSESLNDNYVAQNWVSDFQYYLKQGMTPEDAGEMAISRIFAPPEGDYGAGISKTLEMSWTWKSKDKLAEYYLKRMSNIYTQNNWGISNPTVFTRALTGIGTMYSSRNTNLYGVLDNDDYVDYWGGLYNTLKYVNKGKKINWNVLNYANPQKAYSNSIQKVISKEITTRYTNPNYIEGMKDYYYSGGRTISKSLDTFFKYSELASELTTEKEWNQWANTYISNRENAQWMSVNNPYAYQKMQAKFLNAANNGVWRPSSVMLRQLANEFFKNVRDNGVSCCDCVCGNINNMKFAMSQMDASYIAQFKKIMYQATGENVYQQNDQKTQPQTSPQSVGATQTGLPDSAGSEATTDTSDETGEGSQSEVGDQPGEQTQKAYEVSENTPSGSAQSGLPIAAIAGVIVLVLLVGLGYFKGNILGFLAMLKK